MKKRSILSKLTVMALAMALVLGSGANTLTVHATDDGCYHGNGNESEDYSGGTAVPDAGGSSSDSGSSSSSNDSYSGGGGGSTDDGAYHGNGNSVEDYSGGNAVPDAGGSSNGGGSTYTAPSGLATKGNTATIPGCETFRQINKPASGQVAIYHCGIEQYTAQLTGADGKAVAYASAGAYKDEATGKWYLNITTADGVDTTGYTVGTWKGSVTYLPKLGMSGVALNGVVVVDAEAAAAAK